MIEYRLYYNKDNVSYAIVILGKPTELSGNYIVITKEEYAEANPDVYVKNGKLFKKKDSTYNLDKISTGKYVTSKYDASIILYEHEIDTTESERWDITVYGTN
jgi:hypothetical protein